MILITEKLGEEAGNGAIYVILCDDFGVKFERMKQLEE